MEVIARHPTIVLAPRKSASPTIALTGPGSGEGMRSNTPDHRAACRGTEAGSFGSGSEQDAREGGGRTRW